MIGGSLDGALTLSWPDDELSFWWPDEEWDCTEAPQGRTPHEASRWAKFGALLSRLPLTDLGQLWPSTAWPEKW
ncbi:hypothetical protein AB0P05_35895 [Streptomyces flaveolus]|uniref:hypothetical protein n=1 Tax=Streptomyces flaveolus TaxID=67297 RepID=UPI00343B0ECC